MFFIFEKSSNSIKNKNENFIQVQSLKNKNQRQSNLLKLQKKGKIISNHHGQKISLMNFICFALQKINLKKEHKYSFAMEDYQINFY